MSPWRRRRRLRPPFAKGSSVASSLIEKTWVSRWSWQRRAFSNYVLEVLASKRFQESIHGKIQRELKPFNNIFVAKLTDTSKKNVIVHDKGQQQSIV
jgi:hypothetical protein